MTQAAGLSQKHLTGIDTLSRDDISLLLERTQFYHDNLEADPHYRSDSLHRHTILTLFFENSTRTLMSFETAARTLGADVINFDSATSSLKKGESFMDTVTTLESMIAPDAIIIRHSEYNAPHYIAQHVSCPVINAGDSWREHPTQALLDAFTMKQHKGALDGLTVAICGDIAHSRVANSNMILLEKMGATIHAIAPEYLLPEKFPVNNVKRFTSLEEGLPGCDIVMMLRLQKERMQAGLIKSDTEYFHQYGLTRERLAQANKDALVMHPGPMNRNVEIADDVADDKERSLILKQVRNGVYARMAVLDLLLSK